MFSFFFFNDTATTEIYTLSLHDALPIFGAGAGPGDDAEPGPAQRFGDGVAQARLVLDQQHPCRGGRAALALLGVSRVRHALPPVRSVPPGRSIRRHRVALETG